MNPRLCGLLAIAYLYGAVPFGFLAARLIKGVDIRTTGSGNIGATNAARVLGFRFFPFILLLDLSKGLLPTLAAALLVPEGTWDPHPLAVGTGLAAILGHVFPVYLGFKGGKGVATSTGVFLVLAPWQVLIAAAVWGTMFALWRYVSLASISAAVALPAAVWLMHSDPLGEGLFLTGMATFGGLLVIYLHRANIGRLLAGTEDRIGKGPCEPAVGSSREDATDNRRGET
ncbi:MAG: glycerol-3-phosphate 1-O-acyltransferase PlsY [Candidatus Brocadiaceae bacterium]|jgi:glycerol-3-phosphate acyltransferase PlsY